MVRTAKSAPYLGNVGLHLHCSHGRTAAKFFLHWERPSFWFGGKKGGDLEKLPLQMAAQRVRKQQKRIQRW